MGVQLAVPAGVKRGGVRRSAETQAVPPYNSRLLRGDQTIELPWLASTSKSWRRSPAA